MNIITGRGKARKVLTFPCADIVNRSPKTEQKQAHRMLCNLLQVKA